MHVIKWNKSIMYSNHINQFTNQSQNHICGPPTKARLILHELIPQIPLFRNYENCIHANIKSRGTKDYLKPEWN